MDVGNPLHLLFELNGALLDGSGSGDHLTRALEILGRGMDLPRALVSLVDQRSGRLGIAASRGLSDRERDVLDGAGGDSMARNVVTSGEALTLPRLGDSPVFARRIAAANDSTIADRAFVCVPIESAVGVVGALGAELLPCDAQTLAAHTELLTTAASMIAWSVRPARGDADERQRLLEENRRLKDELKERFRPDNIVGNARPMREVFDLIGRVSASAATVMIRGESGVGKELVAQAIHWNSPRAQGPFVCVNCAALPKDLLESELFGHEKGAFTGALARRRGRFEIAAGGTLFLDEVGDFPPATQVLFLRFLQERVFERVGGNETIRADVRIITATNRNLEELVKSGNFREDLYWRLNVYPIHVPPLRERSTDIPLLAEHFAQASAERAGTTVKRLTPGAVELLTSYPWPGNVRELENAMERAVIESPDGVLRAQHLPPTLQSADASDPTTHGRTGTLADAVTRLERDLITETLRQTRGNRAAAARRLAITERQMGLRVERYSIDWRAFRRGADA
ncbi:MAG: sigma-54-dependent Fis family transcriptional regulator [Planctomycetes bacterium]|nr:sigma-54-dependent Fis family transcriptional regulator [Planctomycetota bacterium]